MNNQPIGIFDSGIGGLTVFHAIWEKLPRESLIYLGDTARVPYGTRGREVICRFALELVGFLLKRKVKALVVACNTVSSTCLEAIQNLSPVPVVDVINPVVREVVKLTQTKVVGVIGTRATIGSRAYEEKIKAANPKIKVLSAACPLFVPIAEEGLTGRPVADLMAKYYLKDFIQTRMDTLILGCTHYPLLRKAIQKTVGREVTILDSALPVAKEVETVLKEKNLLGNAKKPSYEILVTDAPQRVEETARRFFGTKLPVKIEKIPLEKITG